MIKNFYRLYGILLAIFYHILFFFYKFFNSSNGFEKENLTFGNITSNKIVIFGSSKSLLQLKKTEKKILQNLPKIFMNKNLIFWKKLGIWPEFYFLLDTPMKSKPALNIFFQTIKIIYKTKKISPILLLEKFYKFYVPKKLETLLFNFNKSSNLKWANNKSEILFGCHGSLSSLLNIITLLKRFKYILLIGIDLNDPGYFFSKKSKNYYKYIDPKVEIVENKMNLHSNLIKNKKVNILTHWSQINKNLKKRNIDIFCGSKGSELVKKKYIKYMNIKKFYKLK